MGRHSLGRPTVSALPRADVVQFYRDGVVHPGLRTLPLAINGHHIENANITWVPCNYGGARPQWICPRCNEHVLHLYFAHNLLKSFRRVRDYGFLHASAKRTLHLIQLVLKALPASVTPTKKTSAKVYAAPSAHRHPRLYATRLALRITRNGVDDAPTSTHPIGGLLAT
jgi:hypothetical protein